MTDKRDRPASDRAKDDLRPDASKKKRPGNGLDEGWLERRVRDMYQEVVNEPIPDDILSILNRLPEHE